MFADDNIRFDENGRKFPKRIENTVGKGEIAHYKQFLLLPQCFQKTYAAYTYKPGLVWKMVKQPFSRTLITLYQTIPILTVLMNKALENTVGKGENAGDQHFLLFHSITTLSKREIVILGMLNLSSSNAFNLVLSNILLFG